MRVSWDHHGNPLRGGGARDALARPHLRDSGHLVHPRSARCPQDELVGSLVVQVDEASVCLERLGNPRGHEIEELSEIEG